MNMHSMENKMFDLSKIYLSASRKKLIINFYDVGHGSCTHIITPNNKNILVDIGSYEKYSISNYFKNNLRINKMDMLYITHPHKDHIYDLPQLKEFDLGPRVLSRDKSAFPVTHIYAGAETDKKIQDVVNDMNNIYIIPVRPEEDPTKPYNNGDVIFKSISAREQDKNSKDPNSYSSIISLQYKDWKILLTGDNNKEILKNRIETDYEFKKNISNHYVLLAPHHGRDSDFCKEFFDIVNPYITIVSDKNIAHDSQTTTASNYNNDKGLIVNDIRRYVLTTRQDGTIQLIVYEDNKYTINTGISIYGN